MSEPDLRTEMRTAEYEPMLPIEYKLVAWSLGIGIALLILLAIVNRVFPAGS